MLSFPPLPVKSALTLGGLIPGRQIPKHPALEESLHLGFSAKLVVLDVHLCEAGVMKRYYVRGERSNLHMELLLQPDGL